MNKLYSQPVLLNYVGFFALEKLICVKVISGPSNIYEHLPKLFHEVNLRTICYTLIICSLIFITV